MTNHFYYCFSSNDEANYAVGAMLTLDFDLANHIGVSEIFYGYRHHNGGFTIEGFVAFGVDVGDNEAHQLLHGFEVRRYDWFHHVDALISKVTVISLFTKQGTSWDYNYVYLHHQNLLDYYNQNA